MQKKLIDQLQLSKIASNNARALPPVPQFTTPTQHKKISPTDLFGPSDTDSVSEADWAALNAQCSGESSGSEKPSPEDIYSDNYSEKQSSTAESTGSDYESGSSFEAAKRKQAKRKTRGSATCKAAAAGRKQQFQRTKARAFLSSPQSVYLVGKAATSPAQKKKSAAAKKRKSNESPTESEASSASNESESNRSAPTQKKTRPLTTVFPGYPQDLNKHN